MTRRGLLALALGAAALCGAAPAAAEQAPPSCAVVDVGAQAAPAPVRAAVEAAVQAAKRVRPLPDAAVRAALRGEEPASPRLATARVALDAAGKAYGALNCDATIEHAERAVEALEAELGFRPVRDELQRAFTYLLLCRATRDRWGDPIAAAEAAAQLRGLMSQPASAPAVVREGPEADPPPPGVPASVWRRFPHRTPGALDGPLKITSQQEGVQLIVDLRPVGAAPIELKLSPGRHRLVAFKPGFASWRKSFEIGSGRGTTFDLEQLKPAPPEPQATLRAAAHALATLPKGERPAAAARLGRDAGAARVLAIDVFGARIRALVFDAASGKALGGSFEADAKALTARPADLTVFLDGADAAVPGKAPASRPAGHAKIGSKWWHWVIGAAVVAALGVAIWQSEKGSNKVTLRVTLP
jgi:hypothetical protein